MKKSLVLVLILAMICGLLFAFNVSAENGEFRNVASEAEVTTTSTSWWITDNLGNLTDGNETTGMHSSHTDNYTTVDFKFDTPRYIAKIVLKVNGTATTSAKNYTDLNASTDYDIVYGDNKLTLNALDKTELVFYINEVIDEFSISFLSAWASYDVLLREVEVFTRDAVVDAEKLTGLGDVSKFYIADGSEIVDGGMNAGSYARDLFDGDYGAHYNNNIGSYIVTDLNAKLPGGYYVTEIKIYHSNNSTFSLYYSKDGGSTWNKIVEGAQVTEATYAVGDVATQVKYVFDTCANWVASAKEIEIYGIDPAELACLHGNIKADGWMPVPGSATCTGVGRVYQACPDCGEVLEQVSNDVLPLGHVWADATCTAPKTCTACAITDGEALGHEYDWNICGCPVCGELAVPDVEGGKVSTNLGYSVFFAASWSEINANVSDSSTYKVIRLTADTTVPSGNNYAKVQNANIIIDLGGHSITTSVSLAPLYLYAADALVNGTIIHNYGRQALYVCNVNLIESINIVMGGTYSNNATGIYLANNSTYGSRIGSMKNVTIDSKRDENGNYIDNIGLFNHGIEFSNANSIVGDLENVKVYSRGQAITIMAKEIGTMTNCVFSGDNIGVNIKKLQSEMVFVDCEIYSKNLAIYIDDAVDSTAEAPVSFVLGKTKIFTDGAVYDLADHIKDKEIFTELTTAVALVDGRLYNSFEDAVDAFRSSAEEVTTFVLMDDFAVDSTIVIDKKVNFSFGGATYNVPVYGTNQVITKTVPGYTVTSGVDVAFRAVEGGYLTISGDGRLEGTESAIVADGGVVVITAGTYVGFNPRPFVEITYCVVNNEGVYTIESEHDMSIPATCTTPLSCSRGDYTEGEALGHNYYEAERVEPSEFEEGYIKYGCTRCGDTYNEPIPKATVYYVSSLAEYTTAYNMCTGGEIIRFSESFSSSATQLVIQKNITIDLNGYTLTTSNAYGGIRIYEGSLINGKLLHEGRTCAIKVYGANAIEDLVIECSYDGSAGEKTIGGIVFQSSISYVNSIKNVTICGVGLTNGIETYNCPDKFDADGNSVPFVGSIENLTITAKKYGILAYANLGEIANSTIYGGEAGIYIWAKHSSFFSNMSMVNCDIKGGDRAVYFDERNENGAMLVYRSDKDTTYESESGILFRFGIANPDNVIIEIYGFNYPCEHGKYKVELKPGGGCTVDSQELRTCVYCGYQETVTVPAPGHSYDKGTVTPPTCSEDGYTRYACTRAGCGAYDDRDIVPALGHQYHWSICGCPVCGTLAVLDEGSENVSSNLGYKIYFATTLNDLNKTDYDVIRLTNNLSLGTSVFYLTNPNAIIDLGGNVIYRDGGWLRLRISGAKAFVNGYVYKTNGGSQILGVNSLDHMEDITLVANSNRSNNATGLIMNTDGAYLGSMKNVTICAGVLSDLNSNNFDFVNVGENGIYNHGIELTKGTIGSMENVKISTYGQAITSAAKIGTMTNCVFSGDNIALNITKLQSEMKFVDCEIHSKNLAIYIADAVDSTEEAPVSFVLGKSKIFTDGAVYDISDHIIDKAFLTELTTAVALVNAQLYHSLADAINALNASTEEIATFLLMKELVVTETIVIDRKVKFSFGGATYNVPVYGTNQVVEKTIPACTVISGGAVVFCVNQGGELTIIKEGTLDSSNGNGVAITVNGGYVAIKGGFYTNSGKGDIISVTSGTVEISRGRFYVYDPKPYVIEGGCVAYADLIYTVTEAHEWIEATHTAPRTCAKCGLTEGEKLGYNIDNVITFLGHSICQYDSTAGIRAGFKANLDEIKRVEEESGEKVYYGLIFATAFAIGGMHPLDENGNPIAARVIKRELSTKGYVLFDLILAYPGAANLEKEYVMAAYAMHGDNIRYFQGNGAADTVYGESYNEIIYNLCRIPVIEPTPSDDVDIPVVDVEVNIPSLF